ncbi:uncharacterized protein BP01DRAFT_361136 [Aspergillus saccharolyticus JOP 1030-1]|uniref:Uncharacterized protein n=1 Tax=Aspergillus saccharolyticus JOP 1030-1 TaxID=1450539 RepID=A0A318YZX7_9EURO|nr:hypothetical protein BP01DRAFT_361136 [Aspergillus saccharolyticus JOP 1030-1]PYH40545.1 hypothetical protein BP01DRAFT_361136 [Aspergillus saccharolyticus JOP 1030-1]
MIIQSKSSAQDQVNGRLIVQKRKKKEKEKEQEQEKAKLDAPDVCYELSDKAD